MFTFCERVCQRPIIDSAVISTFLWEIAKLLHIIWTEHWPQFIFQSATHGTEHDHGGICGNLQKVDPATLQHNPF
jgi:hypothetical protein